MVSPDAEVASMTPLAGEPHEGSRAVAFWHDRPTTLVEAARQASAVVRGRVLRIVPGEDLVVPTEAVEGGFDRIPTQRILFSVHRVLGGRLATRVIELFRTGSETFEIDEDPAYTQGGEYVLFLTRADRGMYRPIAPEGRLQVTAGGLLPTSKREFMSDLRGRSVESLQSDIAALSPPAADAPDHSALELRRNGLETSSSRVSVSYALPSPCEVKLGVFDAQGRMVRQLVNGVQEGPRWYTVEWDGMNDQNESTPNGVYFVRLATPLGSKSLTAVRIR